MEEKGKKTSTQGMPASDDSVQKMAGGDDSFLAELGIREKVPAKVSGKYIIVKELGTGGMGTVYQALDEGLKRMVAVKVLKNRSGREVARFRREAEVMAKLDHPHIVKVYSVGKEGKNEYLAMEYVEGVSLQELLKRGRMERERALQIGEALCKAMDYAHENGIIHRDLKPANVLIEKNSGRVVVVDFGLAKDRSAMALTQSGEIMGTLRYMAPEQVRGEKITEHADIYALGAILYEMLTGQYAVPGEAMVNIADYIAPKEIAPMVKHDPSIPEELDRIVGKALAGGAKNRHRSAYELGKELKAFRKRGERGRGVDGAKDRKKGRHVRRNAVAVAIIVLALTGAIGILAGRKDSRRDESVPNRGRQATVVGKERVRPEAGMPEGWPEWLWEKCWTGEWLDFTVEWWEKLSAEEQRKYTSAYQVWYAKKKGLGEEETFRAGGAEFTMRLIPPGRFWMGSPEGEPDRQINERRQRVIISKGFWMQKTELTQRQWREVTGTRPWSGKEYMQDEGEHAAAFISWNDVKEKMLAKLGGNWDFPSEAQWEYACRAGTLGSYYWGEVGEMGKYANVADRTLKEKKKDLWEAMQREAASGNWKMVDTRDDYLYIAPAGKLGANAFGLHDMIGNVFEWCRDGYKEESPAQGKDPVNLALGSGRICRGGSWYGYSLTALRAAYRSWLAPAGSSFNLGVRLVVPDAD